MIARRCPACGAALPRTTSGGGDTRCPACGKTLQVEVKAPGPVPALGKGSPAGARAVFEVAGGYAAPVAPAPGRAWQAVAAGDHVDLLDSATGACLDRCRAGGATGAVQDLALSADGRRLAVVFPGPGDPQAGKFTAQLWDLATGRAELLASGSEPYQTACWAGPEHLATFAGGPVLYDLTVRSAVAAYQVPIQGPRWQGPAFARSPDGRLWFHRPDPRPGGGPQPSGAWWAITEPELLGAPARAAITDEVLDTQAQQPTPLEELPAAWLKIGREYRPLPQRFNPVSAWPAPENGAGPGPGRPALKR